MSVEDAAQTRAKYGLASDEATVRQVMSDPDNVIADWPGLYATPAERESLDLSGRMAFANAVGLALHDYLEQQPTLAGFWFDQTQDGGLVVALTERNPELEAQITERLPSPSKGLRFVTAEHTLADLREAQGRVGGVWEDASLHEPNAAGIIQRANSVLVRVALADVDAALSRQGELEADLGVSLKIEGVVESGDASCDRLSCSPDADFRAGMLLKNGSPNNLPRCTAAFILYNSGWAVPYQVLTAGHCWRVDDGSGGYMWDNVSSHWFWDGKDLGPTKDKTPYANGESDPFPSNVYTQDIIRIGLVDNGQSGDLDVPSDLSDHVFNAGTNQHIHDPITADALVDADENAIVCASLGMSDQQNYDGSSNGIHCGTIDAADIWWLSNLGPWRVVGADVDFDDNYQVQGGDSGSPVYTYEEDANGVRDVTPLGVADDYYQIFDGTHYHKGVYFAELKTAIGTPRWSVTDWDDAVVWGSVGP